LCNPSGGGRREIAKKRRKSDKLSDMEEKHVNHKEQIPPENWGKTPTSVQKLVEAMAQQIEQQEKKLTEVLTVQEQLLEKN